MSRHFHLPDLQRAISLNGETLEPTVEEPSPGTSIVIRDVLELPRDVQNQLVERLESRTRRFGSSG